MFINFLCSKTCKQKNINLITSKFYSQTRNKKHDKWQNDVISALFIKVKT